MALPTKTVTLTLSIEDASFLADLMACRPHDEQESGRIYTQLQTELNWVAVASRTVADGDDGAGGHILFHALCIATAGRDRYRRALEQIIYETDSGEEARTIAMEAVPDA